VPCRAAVPSESSVIASVLKLYARRLLAFFPILLVVSALLFCALRVLPVDPAAMSLPPTATIAEIEAKRHEMGLDQPLALQYLIWLKDALHGEFGRSIHYRRDAAALIGETLPATLELALLAMMIATLLGMAGGLLLFRLRGSLLEAALDFCSLLLLSIPEFLWGLILLFLFGVTLHILPFTGRLSADLVRPNITGFLLVDAVLSRRLNLFYDAATHLALPALALGLAFSPTLMRVLRSSLLDVYHEDYIQQARLRGLSENRILVRHALKNAILPTLTIAGVQFGFLFGGTLLVEIIYSYPGLGNLMVDAVRNADLPIIQAVGLTYCVVVLLINTLVDGLYLVLNPKLRVQ
jgi:dipeptide transport system permease protein